MSNEIFPALIGETYPQTRTPVHSTLIQQSASGREVRIAQFPYPRYIWSIPYSYLSAEQALSHFQTLIGFFNARHGSYDSFLYSDPYDKQVTDQPIGTGNGSKTEFPLVRTFGSSTEGVYDLNGALTVKLDGVETADFTFSSTTGLITFNAAPGNGVAITASFSYYWRVRFMDDKADFDNFVYQLFELKKIQFISTRD